MRKTAVSLLTLCVAVPIFAGGHEVAKPILGPSPRSQSVTTVATNGETFATVWADEKVYGAIADAAGKRTNAADLILLPQSATGLKLTALGRDYVLFWSANGTSHLTDLGPNLQPTGTVVIAGLPSLIDISIAASTTQILIVGTTATWNDVAYVINRDGSIAAGPIELSNFGGLRLPIQTSWSGHDFLIASTTPTGVLLRRIANGSLTNVPITSTYALWAAAASSGNETIVALMEFVVGGPAALWSAVVDGDTVVSMRQVARFTTSGGYLPNIVWNGDAYVVTGGNFGVRLDRSGAVLEPPVGLEPTVQAFAATGDVFYGISQGWDFNSVFPKLIVTIAQTSGGIHDLRYEYPSTSPSAEDGAAIASDGLDFIAAFRDTTAAAQSIAVAPLPRSPSDGPSDAIPLANTNRGSMPAIAHGASVNVVAWADANGVYARRVTCAGVLLDAQPIAIAGPWRPIVDVAWNGRAFLVAWVGDRGVFGATVDENGTPSEPRLIGPRGTGGLRVGWNGKLFLVVYKTPRGCYPECPGYAATFAVRVAANGVPIDTSPVAIDTSTDFIGAPIGALASDGTRFLIALGTQSGIELVPVTADDFSITIGPRQPVFSWVWGAGVDIRWAGTDYVLASSYAIDHQAWLATTRISRDGQPSGQKVTPVAASFFAAPVPAVAVNSAGESAVLVAEPVGDPPVPRVRAYFDSDLAPARARPAAPTAVAATGVPSNFTVMWNVGSDADGVVIQYDSGGFLQNLAVVPATESSRTFSNSSALSVIVRAFNAGGMSEPVTTSVRVPTRRRAVH